MTFKVETSPTHTMIRILSLFLLVAVVSCQDHHHLKIAEKFAIPHHIRHAYDYPHINFQRQQPAPAAAAAPAPAAPQSQPSSGFQRGFSQADPSSFMMRQPQISSFEGRQQEVGAGRPVSAPVRQTRYFNLYTPGNGPEFSLERRES